MPSSPCGKQHAGGGTEATAATTSGLIFDVHPDGQLAKLHDAVESVIERLRGPEAIRYDTGVLHLTLAYANGDADGEDIQRKLRRVRPNHAMMTIKCESLTQMLTRSPLVVSIHALVVFRGGDDGRSTLGIPPNVPGSPTPWAGEGSLPCDTSAPSSLYQSLPYGCRFSPLRGSDVVSNGQHSSWEMARARRRGPRIPGGVAWSGDPLVVWIDPGYTSRSMCVCGKGNSQDLDTVTFCNPILVG